MVLPIILQRKHILRKSVKKNKHILRKIGKKIKHFAGNRVSKRKAAWVKRLTPDAAAIRRIKAISD